MTKEEAINVLENGDWWEELSELYEVANKEHGKLIEAIDMAINALQKQQEWVSTSEQLPPNNGRMIEYIVTVWRTHYPTSPDDFDAPYDEEFVTTAYYDGEQKIWHLHEFECLNALLKEDEAPMNGDYITQWMPMPKPYEMVKR